MKRVAFSLLLSVLAGTTSGVVAQTTIEEARKQGADLGKMMRADESLGPNDAKLSQLPGYGGTDLAEKVYFDDPDRLVVDGGSKAGTDEAFGTVTDRAHTRATFSNAEILAATSRGTAIEKDPDTYLGGQSLGGADGTCTALPPSVGSKGYYEATCNKGSKVTDTVDACRGNLVPTVINTARWFYYGAPDKNEGNGFARTTVMQAKVAIRYLSGRTRLKAHLRRTDRTWCGRGQRRGLPQILQAEPQCDGRALLMLVRNRGLRNPVPSEFCDRHGLSKKGRDAQRYRRPQRRHLPGARGRHDVCPASDRGLHRRP